MSRVPRPPSSSPPRIGQPSRSFTVSTGVRSYRESTLQYNLRPAYDRITGGRTHLLIIGDSRYAASSYLPRAMAGTWNPTNGWAGWFFPCTTATASDSDSSAIRTWASAGVPTEQPVAYGAIFSGNGQNASITNMTYTAFQDPTTYSSSQILTSVVTPVGFPAVKYAFNGGAPAYTTLRGVYMTAMGTCQATGTVWASGDWVTGKTLGQIRFGVVYVSHSACPAGSKFSIDIFQGTGNNDGSGVAASAADVTFGTAATPVCDIAWTNIPTAQMANPFGDDAASNSPGISGNPLFYQLLGVGTRSPGTKMDSTQLGSAGNANYTGCWDLRFAVKNNAITNGNSMICYGIAVEDLTKTTGLFVSNMGVSGATLRWFVDGMTNAQWAATLNYKSSDPVNLVWFGLGENHTAAEWNGTTTSSTQLRTDILANLQAIWSGADTAGIARPFTILESPWSNVGGAKPEAYYSALDTVCRQLAKDYPTLVGHVSTYQGTTQAFTADQKYNASRNVHMNALCRDGVHTNHKGAWWWAKFVWDQIMNPVEV